MLNGGSMYLSKYTLLTPPPPAFDGKLDHCGVNPSAHLYTRVGEGTLRVQHPAQEHNCNQHVNSDWSISIPAH